VWPDKAHYHILGNLVSLLGGRDGPILLDANICLAVRPIHTLSGYRAKEENLLLEYCAPKP